MNITLNSCEISISQIPNKENGFHAVCTTRIVSASGQTFAAIGEAVGGDNDSDQSLLQRAGQCSYDRAVALMRQHTDSSCSNYSSTPLPWKPASARPKSSTGGPITDKQKRLLETTAHHNGKTLQDAEAISQELYNRPINNLTTKEVNPILDRLRA